MGGRHLDLGDRHLDFRLESHPGYVTTVSSEKHDKKYSSDAL